MPHVTRVYIKTCSKVHMTQKQMTIQHDNCSTCHGNKMSAHVMDTLSISGYVRV
jgi:excinuclease UvrABC ATPase subunit